MEKITIYSSHKSGKLEFSLFPSTGAKPSQYWLPEDFCLVIPELPFQPWIKKEHSTCPLFNRAGKPAIFDCTKCVILIPAINEPPEYSQYIQMDESQRFAVMREVNARINKNRTGEVL
jgi:hypothetical protein